MILCSDQHFVFITFYLLLLCRLPSRICSALLPRFYYSAVRCIVSGPHKILNASVGVMCGRIFGLNTQN